VRQTYIATTSLYFVYIVFICFLFCRVWVRCGEIYNSQITLQQLWCDLWIICFTTMYTTHKLQGFELSPPYKPEFSVFVYFYHIWILDMQKLFTGKFEDFNLGILKSLYFWKCQTSRLYIIKNIHVCRFRGLPTGCVCVRAACGASATSEKNTPLDFWSMYLVDFVILGQF